jgi:hypothetical protein
MAGQRMSRPTWKEQVTSTDASLFVGVCGPKRETPEPVEENYSTGLKACHLLDVIYI